MGWEVVLSSVVRLRFSLEFFAPGERARSATIRSNARVEPGALILALQGFA